MPVDISGQKFGRLTVIGVAEGYQQGRYKVAAWQCQCDCGNSVVVRGHHLKAGNSKSCGYCTQYRIEGEYALGKLRNGVYFLIDAQDLPRVKERSWGLSGNGYIQSGNGINTPHILLHRFILGVEGVEVTVDHVNGNPLDNRRSNLRVASYLDNARNQSLRSTSTTGYKGVSFSTRKGMFRAYINYDYRQQHLGYYMVPEEAAIAYNEAALRYFGEYARINVVGQPFTTISARELRRGEGAAIAHG